MASTAYSSRLQTRFNDELAAKLQAEEFKISQLATTGCDAERAYDYMRISSYLYVRWSWLSKNRIPRSRGSGIAS
jgi:hypothetical protein